MLTVNAMPSSEVALPLTSDLPAPFGSAAREVHAETISSLQAGDECRLIASLLFSARELSPVERPLATWLPCIIGLDERSHLRQPLPNTAAILKFIRGNLRSMLIRFPLEGGRCRWLVPASAGDLTAVYAAALLLVQQGTVANPWIWGPLPPAGGFITIGTTRMQARLHRHPRSLGRTTLLDLYPHAEPMRLPKERLSAAS
jgi:hypothetical protein